MKAWQVFAFICVVFIILAIIGFVLPSGGLQWIVPIKFIHPLQILYPEKKQIQNDNIPSSYEHVLNCMKFYKVKHLTDSMQFLQSYRQIVSWSMVLPDKKEDYLDPLFLSMDSSFSQKKIVRILHFGDSQIESDRITGYIRDALQKKFGGCGLGFVPLVQPIPSLTYWIEYTGGMFRYAAWDPAELKLNQHTHGLNNMNVAMGPWAQRFYLDGQASITLKRRTIGNYPGSSAWTLIRLFFEPDSTDMKANVFVGEQELVQRKIDGGSRIGEIRWQTSKPIGAFKMLLEGKRNFYGISLECSSGVVVDNIPMRGASGTIFRNISLAMLREAKSKLNISCIILQYGGNVMPVINSFDHIRQYCNSIRKQIEHLKQAFSDVVIIFIGPSDMSKNIDGKLETYPFLPELNDSLKATCLKSGVAYWDMFRAMGGKNSMQQWVAQRLAASDYIHFSNAGTLKIAEMFMNALWLEYEIYKLRHQIKKHHIQ